MARDDQRTKSLCQERVIIDDWLKLKKKGV